MEEAHTTDIDARLKGRLKVAAALTAVIFVAELAGGLLTNSLALISDAVHVFMDLLALSLSFFALYISALPPDEKRTYGLHRAEVFVSFINGALLVAVSGFVIYKGYTRLLDPQEVKSGGMLVVAAVGFVVNLVVALWLRGYARDDLNIKSAFLHVVGDAAASLGVIAAALVIHFTGAYAVDPAISMVIGGIILFGAGRIVLEASHILLEGVPREVDFGRVLGDISAVEGVEGVHSLHIWSICHNVNALSAHVDIAGGHISRRALILKEINERLAERHHIFYTTLQAECPTCERSDLFRAIEHTGRGHLH